MDFSEKKVAVAGLGGLGSNIAVMLARSGVGRLLLVDFDSVSESNLNRQYYATRHIGMYKTVALEIQLADIAPSVTVEIQTVKVTEENVAELFKDYDVICEAFDNPQSKAMLINELLPEGKIIVSGSGMSGFGSCNDITTKRVFKNLYVCGDGGEGTKFFAPRVSVCAGHQANMILRILMGIEDI